MKKQTTIFIVILLSGLAACTPKPQQRMPHEGKREWNANETKSQAVTVSSVEFAKLDLKKLDEAASGPVGQLDQDVIRILSPYVWNAKFVSNPANRQDGRLERAITILHTAFLRAIEGKGALSEELRRSYLVKFENAVFSECQQDLRRGCVNASLFGVDARTSRLIYHTALAEEFQLDQEIGQHDSAAKCIQASKSCREMIHLRYRRLAMALMIKRSKEMDQDLSFAFMKYARVLSELTKSGEDAGYLTTTYASIFEMLVTRYTPMDPNSPEFRKFIENFIPWNFSNRKLDVFRTGSKALFDLAATCCLYEDAGKTKLAPSVLKAIRESQGEGAAVMTAGAPAQMSFHQIVKKILGSAQPNTPNILSDLGMNADIPRISNLNSGFYNEYFFLIDRLFNDHLDSSQAMRILERTNPERMNVELLSVLLAYMRVQLVNLTMDTTDFMTKIYNSKSVSSDALFQEAITVSKELSSRWMRTQTQLNLLDGFIGSYYKRFAVLPKEYIAASRIMRSFNRNVHYLSVYPNMIGMTYFLAKKQGVIKARSWWGAEFEIKPESVVGDLFEGQFETPWFKFAADTLAVSRERLFLAFYYALKTRALDTFTVEENDKSQSDRSKFIELTIGKYLQHDRRTTQEVQQTFERNVLNTEQFLKLETICAYEASAPGQMAPPLTMDIGLEDLARYTYTGHGGNGINSPIGKFLSGDLGSEIERLLQDVEPRKVFSKAVVGIVEDHLKTSGETKNQADVERELGKVNGIIGELEQRERSLLTLYSKHHKRLFDCGIHLYNVELLRSYRMYEEERKHLELVHDLLKNKIKSLPPGPAQNAKVNDLNKEYFPEGKVRFDQLMTDGYKYSRLDFLMRARERVEQDIFSKPSAGDLKIFAEKGYSPVEIARLVRPRPVRVTIPQGLERLGFVVQSEARTIDYVESKEQFVRNALTHLNGSGGSYAEWMKQADQLNGYKSYLETLIDLYLLGDYKVDGKELDLCQEADCVATTSVAPKDIFATYKTILGLVDLTSVDVEMANIFGLDGRTEVAKLEGFLLEPQSLRSLPLVRFIAKRIYERAGFSVAGNSLIQRGRTLGVMLTTEGDKIFEPNAAFGQNLIAVYRRPIFRILSRGTELLNLMPSLEQDPAWRSLLKTKIRMEDKQVVTFETHPGRNKYDILDIQTLSDYKTNSADYTHMTADFFDTKKLLVITGEEK